MVSERSVSRYLRTLLRRAERRQSWITFLRNHREVIAAMDFFTVPTATFRIFYVLFVIRHRRREILHWNLTAHPTASWVMQQLREASPSIPQRSTWSSTVANSFSDSVQTSTATAFARYSRTITSEGGVVTKIVDGETPQGGPKEPINELSVGRHLSAHR
jgi:transposase InsO family protein